MAESDYSFPTAPSFTESAFPPPPQRGAKTVDKYLKEIEQYLQVQLVGLTEMQATLMEGYIIDVLRVNGLEANTILANSIITNDFFIGSDGSGSIEMSGSTNQIIIKDEAGVDRVIMGDFGASNSDWGIKVLDSTGTVKFQSTSTTFIDGAIITDATIVNAKIVNATIDGSTKLVNSSVPNSKISDISASKINAGTITVDGSPAISVTSSGAVVFSAGGDIIMRAAVSGDTNYIIFETSGGTDKALITYSVSSDTVFFVATGGALATLGSDADDVDIVCGSSSTIDITASGGAKIIVGTNTGDNIALQPVTVTTSAGDFRASVDSTYDNGSTDVRWANTWSDLYNGADYGMDNGVRITEPDKVYSTADPLDGILLMRPDKWEPFLWFHLDGTVQSGGFLEPDIAKNLQRDEELVDSLKNQVRLEMMNDGTYLTLGEQEVTRRAQSAERQINKSRPLEDSRKDSRRCDYDEKLDPSRVRRI